MDVQLLLKEALQHNASDVHLSAGSRPMMRVDGDLCVMASSSLSDADVLAMLDEVLNEEQQQAYLQHQAVDFSFEISDVSRFRGSAFLQARGASVVFRCIPLRILSMSQLQLPSVFFDMVAYTSGLVLLTGPAGSGKSTTLAAMIDHINETKKLHIITIEDPIEFIYPPKQSLLSQREVGRDTDSFHSALRSALRSDPNIILLGELRDLETIRLALTAAETGHLVFATLHTASAVAAVSRMIDVFPGDEQARVRGILSESLQAVVAQRLVKKLGGGRRAAWEIMICHPAMRHLIRENKTAQMYSAMQTGQAYGMTTFDQSLCTPN